MRLIAGVLACAFTIALGSSLAPIRASAQPLPDPTPVTDCLKPYRKGQHPAAGEYGVVVNSCAFPIYFMLCNDDAKPGAWNATQACVGKTGSVGGNLGVAANGRTGVFVGEKAFWFACRAPLSLRGMKFDPAQGLSGRCSMSEHEDAPPAKKAEAPPAAMPAEMMFGGFGSKPTKAPPTAAAAPAYPAPAAAPAPSGSFRVGGLAVAAPPAPTARNASAPSGGYRQACAAEFARNADPTVNTHTEGFPLGSYWGSGSGTEDVTIRYVMSSNDVAYLKRGLADATSGMRDGSSVGRPLQACLLDYRLAELGVDRSAEHQKLCSLKPNWNEAVLARLLRRYCH